MRRGVWQRLAYAVRHHHEIDIKNSIISRIPPRWLGIPPARYAVYGGTASQMENPLVTDRTIPVIAHVPDYDQFLRIKKQGIAAEDSAVFIDQYSPFHPDLQEYNNLGRLDPNSYFANLDGLFSRIEKELGLPIVIAAHPRADYRNMSNVFGGRQIFYHATPDCIARSRLVISHDSLAIGYAVMFGKPILPIAYRDRYNLNPVASYVYRAFGKALGKPYQFLEEWRRLDLSSAFEINSDAYAQYMEKFVKIRGSREAYFWDIVFDTVNGAATENPRSCVKAFPSCV